MNLSRGHGITHPNITVTPGVVTTTVGAATSIILIPVQEAQIFLHRLIRLGYLTLCPSPLLTLACLKHIGVLHMSVVGVVIREARAKCVNMMPWTRLKTAILTSLVLQDGMTSLGLQINMTSLGIRAVGINVGMQVLHTIKKRATTVVEVMSTRVMRKTLNLPRATCTPGGVIGRMAIE